MEVILRIAKDETNYYNPGFAGGNKLYIDGCTEYLNQKEKKLVMKFFETYSDFKKQ